MICLQLGLLPELDREAPSLFTASERLLQDFAKEKNLNASFVKDLIQKLLHHPDFDPAEVDHEIIDLPPSHPPSTLPPSLP